MNIAFKRVSIEKVLFLDLEVVRASEELDPNSKEFALYQKKIRNRETDELPTEQETIEHYKKRGALKMGYTKIVTTGVGFIRAGEVYIKALVGEEKDILRELFEIASQFDYVSGVNILEYDLPMSCLNASKYFDYTEILPDRFVTNNKRPWDLKCVLDLQEVIRGTHYSKMSFDEMLYHFGLESSKDDIDGSMVSDVYYSEGIERIATYVKKDVFQSINLFRRLQFQPIYNSYIDRSKIKEQPPTPEPLKDIYNSDYFSDQAKQQLGSKFPKKLTKKDRETIKTILEAIYIRSEFQDTDNLSVQTAKKSEIEEFVKTLK